MAYVSYKDKNKSGHYDWNILIALVLFLVAIIAFVLYKVFVLAEPATPSTSVTPVVQAPVAKPNTNSAAKQEKAVEPKVTAKEEPASVHSAAKTESVVSHVTPSSGKAKDEAMVVQPIGNDSKPVDKASLKCSAEDQKAGLCN